MVERLEADLGVTVQEVRFPELRYGFQIWDTYMGLPDKEGNVGRPDAQQRVPACTSVQSRVFFISFPDRRKKRNRKNGRETLELCWCQDSLSNETCFTVRAGRVSVTAPIVLCCPEMVH